MDIYFRLGILLITLLFLALLCIEIYNKKRRRHPVREWGNLFDHPTQMETKKIPTADDLLVINVWAKPGARFASYDLLQAISATGMQFGEMNIFHFYQTTPMEKIALFSLASANEPGEFDLNQMGGFSCQGLSLFIHLPQVPNAEHALRLMLNAAQQLSDDLDGELRIGRDQLWNDEIKLQYQKKAAAYVGV